MTAAIDQEQFDSIDGTGETILGVASSDSLPVQDQTADLNSIISPLLYSD